MDVHQRNDRPGNGPSLLKCRSCFRAVEPPGGEVDETGYALCEVCAAYQRGYRDAQSDAARALALVVRAAELQLLHPDGLATSLPDLDGRRLGEGR